MTTSELLSLLGVGPAAPTLFELGRLDTWRLVEQVGAEAANTVRAAIELGRRALRARDVRPRLKTAREAFLYLEPALAARRRERFHVLCLSSKRVLLADVLVAEGQRTDAWWIRGRCSASRSPLAPAGWYWPITTRAAT